MSEIRKHFNALAEDYDRQKSKNAYYHGSITNFYKQVIPPGSRVLEVGCATGELLNAVKPSYGLGIDISEKMIEKAGSKFPHLGFAHGTIRSIAGPDNGNFDFIIVSDLLDYVDDVYAFFGALKEWAGYRTKIIINNLNPVWAPFMRLAVKLRLRNRDTNRNFLTLRDISSLLETLDFDISAKGFRLIVPLYVPIISPLVNKILPRLYGINNLSFMQFVVCRKRQKFSKRGEMSCSVVVPCHNEEGNVEECVRRIPDMGKFTEIIIAEDGSTDRTYEIAKELAKSDKRLKVVKIEKNLGKGNAVRTGFDNASGDVLIILDADMTVSPEDLPKFFNTIADGHAEFVNGTRMIYPMEKEAMKFANFLGNKAFGIMLSIVMGQRNTDTLCGTKALLKRHYRHIEMKKCKWGDFDLLYGAAKLRLKMAEMPVHYRTRKSGSSKMKALRHGLGMAMGCLKMLRKLK